MGKDGNRPGLNSLEVSAAFCYNSMYESSEKHERKIQDFQGGIPFIFL